MSQKSSEPSPSYVFVVLALATFLLLFSLTRKPGILFETEAVIRLVGIDGAATDLSDSDFVQLRRVCQTQTLSAESILDGMDAAEMVQGASPESLAIAREIAARMRVRSVSHQGQQFLRLLLVTERPDAGRKLLDSLELDLADSHADISSVQRFPAIIARQRGGSISAAKLMLLCIVSAMIGGVGMFMQRRTEASPILLTATQVRETSGVPVVGNFSAGQRFDSAEARRRHKRQRVGNTVLRSAEIGVAAVFVMMVYHLAAQDTLIDRFLVDPLATYGEVLTNVIG